MGKTLVIVESPAKAKTISKFLGRQYTVKASVGHVRDLPRSQFGVDIAHGFAPKYINIRGKGEVIKELRAAANSASQVLLATDPDREGEAISWHLGQVLGLSLQKPCRIEFHEITRNAIQQALKNPRVIDMRLVDAQQGRRVLDRLVGYQLSPLLWRKIRRGLSAGRVQSVALRLIVDREREVRAFVPQEYWTITAHLHPQADPGAVFAARLLEKSGSRVEIPTQAVADQMVAELEKASFIVQDVICKEKRRYAAPPFTTSSLQQEAARKLGFTARKTMQIAQQLYEGLEVGSEGPVGLITYIRTDAVRVAPEAEAMARQFIAGQWGTEYVPPRPPQYKARASAQQAHEAIRPTSVERTPDSLAPYLRRDQLRLYKLIWDRFLASQMAPAILDTIRADIVAGSYLLRATGSQVKFPGFLRLYEEGRDEAARRQSGAGSEPESEESGASAEGWLPPLEKGQTLGLKRLEPEQHFTEPPPRYTEASLVKTLEELGIGRPSTYAAIIDTLREREYVQMVERHFQPTELGIVVTDLLRKHFPAIVDVEFTARMEERLDQVEEGLIPWQTVVQEFYSPFSEMLAKADKEIERVQVQAEPAGETCELCGRPMVVRRGRFGPFVACSGYPECKNTHPLRKRTGVHCPECGGEIVQRRSKKGRVFYGCEKYPSCRFVTWYEPVAKACPRCGKFLVRRRRGKQTILACVDEQCGYTEEAALPDEASQGEQGGQEELKTVSHGVHH